MSEEVKAPQKEVSVKKGRKKAPITIAVIAAIVVVAGAGFWVWHEQLLASGENSHLKSN